MKPKFGTQSPQLPIRITRPMTASHIPYSINQITKSLAAQVETEVTGNSEKEKHIFFPVSIQETKNPLKK